MRLIASSRPLVPAATVAVLSLVLATRARADTATSLGDRSGESSTPFTGLAKSPEANLFTGALGTSIPIELPPGRKNMTPQLVLQYSSSAGPGPFGYGWDLPIGRVERSTKWGVPRCGDGRPAGDPLDTDGDDHANDFVLMMPGVTAELVNDPPNSDFYRPRIEQSYLLVQKNDEGNTFTAIDRGGIKYTFGTNPDARAGTDTSKFMEEDASGFCNFTTTWALTSIQDPNGNYIAVTWSNFFNRNVLYPTSVLYGGNDDADIDDVYGVYLNYDGVALDDRWQNFRSGAPATIDFRLSTINVYASSTPIRTYTLTYNDQDPTYTHTDGPRSQLVAVSKTGYPTQHFAYSALVDQHDASAPLSITPPVAGQNYLRAWNDSQEVFQTIIDMTGDGLPDILRTNAVETPSGLAIWRVFEGSANVGFDATPTIWQLPNALSTQQYLRRVDMTDGEARTTKDVFDITGDGIPDYVDASGDPWEVWPGGAEDGVWGFGGINPDGSWTLDPTRPPMDWDSPRGLVRIDDRSLPGNPSKTYQDVIDMNADGRPDLVYTEPGEAPPYTWKIYLNTGSGFEPAPLPYFPAPWDYISTTVQEPQLANGNTRNPMLSDFNGDGLPDMLRIGSSYHDTRCETAGVLAQCIEVYFNTGQGFTSVPQLETIPPIVVSLQDARRLGGSGGSLLLHVENDIIDINGDGLPDFVADYTTYAPNGGYRFLLNIGGRLEPAGFEAHQEVVGGVTYTQRRAATRYWDLAGPIRKTFGRQSIADMIDIDGDGMLDRIDTSTAPWQVVLNRTETATRPNLLTVMENGIGGTNTVAYMPSTRYDNTGGDGQSDLPSVSWVVAGLRQNDGCDPGNVNVFDYGENTCLQNGHELVTSIIYQDGRFDAPSREFRGFRTVVQRRIDGPNDSFYRNETITTFGQEDLTKGQILNVQQWAGSSSEIGSLIRVEQRGWQTRVLEGHHQLWLANHNVVSVDLPGSVPLYEITTNSTPDAYGNIVHSYRSDLFDVNRVDTYTEYADRGVLGFPLDRPSHSKTTDSTGTLEEKWFYYDGPPGGLGLDLHDVREGNVVRVESWLNTPGAQNPQTRMLYDPTGNIVWLLDANGNSTFTTYDSNALHEQVVTNALSHETYTETDLRWGKPTLVRDANGADTRFEYDSAGRITCVARPGDVAPNCTLKYEYHFGTGPSDLSYVRVKQKQNDAGSYTDTTQYFDALGRASYGDVDRIVEGGASLVKVRTGHVVYDAGGRVTTRHHPYLASGSPNNGSTSLSYFLDGLAGLNDPLGRVYQVTQSDGSSTRTLYRGRKTISYDPDGNKTTTEVDNLRNIVDRQIFEGDGSSWYARFENDYDGLGRLLTVRQNGISLAMTTNTYDSLGRKKQTVDRDSGTWKYFYDAVGNLLAQDDPKTGQHIQYCYDQLYRPVRRCLLSADFQSVQSCSSSCGGETISYKYDTGVGGAMVPNAKGRLTRVLDESGENRIEAYDARGRVATSTKTIAGESATVSYTYDPADRVRLTTYPDGEIVQTEYDASGQPSGLRRLGGAYYVKNARYDVLGRMKRLDHAGNVAAFDVVRTMTYYAAGAPEAGPGEGHKLKTIQVQKGAESYLDLHYDSYTVRGQVASIVDDAEVTLSARANDVDYTYDFMGRLDTADSPIYDQQYDYDALGNILAIGPRTFTYANPALSSTKPHQVVSTQVTGGPIVSVAHDSNGNRDDIGDQQYEFTPEDRLESIDLGSGSVDFVYDYEGRMAIKSDGINGLETHYFGDLAETTDDGFLTKWYFFAGMRVASIRTDTWTFAALEQPAVEIAAQWRGRPVMILGLRRDAQIAAGGTTALLATALLLAPWRRRRVVGIAVRQGHVIGIVLAFTISTFPYPLLIRSAEAQNCSDPTPTPLAPSATPTHTQTPTRTPTATRTSTRTPTRTATPLPITQVRHYHHDHLGSVQVITNEFGGMVEQIRYYPFGEIRNRWDGHDVLVGVPDSNGRHEFTDYETEVNSGLQYAGARFYDPTFATFVTHDPVRQFASPYTYTNWNPTNRTDPKGAEAGTIIGLLVVGFIVGFAASALQAAENGAKSSDALKAGLIGGAIGGATSVGLGIAGAAINSIGNFGVSLAYQSALVSAAGYGAYQGFSTGNGVFGVLGTISLAFGLYGLYNLVRPSAVPSALASRAANPSSAAASSGNYDFSDPRFQEILSKVKEAADVVNPPSVASNREYASFTFDAGGGIEYTSTVVSAPCGATECTIWAGPLYDQIPPGADISSFYHSHGAGTFFEYFSGDDVTAINAFGSRHGASFVGGFISTGAGSLRFYEAGTLPDGTFTLGDMVGTVPIK